MQKSELSIRESQVAELVAWGCSQKEVADHLGVSQCTVDNHIQKIKKKIGCNKINEISAWWFCTRFNISFDLSPLRRSVLAGLLLCLFVAGELYHTSEICRYRQGRSRNHRIECIRYRFKK